MDWFRFGEPIVGSGFVPQPPWAQLRLPRGKHVAVLAFTIATSSLLAWLAFASHQYTVSSPYHALIAGDIQIRDFVYALIAVLVMHEPTHALGYPGGAGSTRAYYGMRRSLDLWTVYDGELSRARTLVVKALPLLLLSILPLAAMYVASYEPVWLVAIVFMNLLGATGDILDIIAVMFQVRRGGRTREKDAETWWTV